MLFLLPHYSQKAKVATNDFLDMPQRMPLTCFDEYFAVISNYFEMSWSQLLLPNAVVQNRQCTERYKFNISPLMRWNLHEISHRSICISSSCRLFYSK